MTARVGYLLSVLVLAAGALVGSQFSSATFTDESTTGTQVTAARDWTAPTVAIDDPGFVVSGTVTLTATASDEDTAVDTVEMQYRLQGTDDWISICIDADSPWECDWATASVTDDVYLLRAIATDIDGNSETSATVTTEVFNTAGVVIDPVPSPIRGTVTLTARVVNVVGPSTITFQGAPTGTESWTTLCSESGPEASCDFNTAPYPSGTYDLRAVGTGANGPYTDVQTGIVVDNTAPVLALSAPAGPLSGAVEITAEASDVHTSVSSVLFEYQLGSGAWTTCRDDQAAPYTCDLDTTTLADGTYNFRATATDVVGNSANTVVSRVVDNVAPTVTLSVPTGVISTNVDLTAIAADSGSGVAGVDFQYRLQGAGSWSNCGATVTVAPYACTFLATNLPNGTYEFRAIATDGTGRTTASTVESRVVQTLKLDLADLPAAVGLTTPLTAVWSGSSTSVNFQYAPTGTQSWSNICTGVTANPTAPCSWSLPGNGTYDVRASTVVGGVTYTDVVTTIVDKNAPSAATLTVPAQPINGIVTLIGTGTDKETGIQSAVFEYQLRGASTWTTCGTDTTAPDFTCDLDTSKLTDAEYEFKVTVYDLAGGSRSDTQRRRVDSATGSVVVTSPTDGSTVFSSTSAEVTVSATSNRTISSVLVQYRLAGSTTWVTICTDTTAPYSCAWNNSALSSGNYEMQAVLNKSNGYTNTSAMVSFFLDRFQGFSIDATPAEGQNSGNTAPSLGDEITFTYNGPVNLSTIKPGFTSSDIPTPVEVVLNGKSVTAGQAVAGDEWLSFPDANLGQVAINVDHIAALATTTFAGSTMTASTTDGVTTVVVRLGEPLSVPGLAKKGNSAMIWTPSASVQHIDGRACSTVTVTETGAGDKDL